MHLGKSHTAKPLFDSEFAGFSLVWNGSKDRGFSVSGRPWLWIVSLTLAAVCFFSIIDKLQGGWQAYLDILMFQMHSALSKL